MYEAALAAVLDRDDEHVDKHVGKNIEDAYTWLIFHALIFYFNTPSYHVIHIHNYGII